jgi:hypothetical protein
LCKQSLKWLKRACNDEILLNHGGREMDENRSPKATPPRTTFQGQTTALEFSGVGAIFPPQEGLQLQAAGNVAQAFASCEQSNYC